MTEGGREGESSLWSSYRVREAARGLVILRPTPALLSSLSSPPPQHDKPDRLSIKEPQAASLFFLLFLLICHPHCLGLGRLTGTGCLCQAWPLSSQAWHGGAPTSPGGSVQKSHLMGLGAFANLSTNLRFGAAARPGALALDCKGTFRFLSHG
ncbi:hypothetical protein PBY51_016839 [Eleginops maclovinus]|uniref:Uncharacterized protein n=1 Tax=Eleginops maclovinus TaxID=56733 RepID=A0AAN8AA64_ELEMC|nr:hypothetical protein PBY51_016839 [Eleginops maclovinus]